MLVVVFLALAAAHAAEAPAPYAPPTTRTTVYFLADGGAAPIGVRRTIARRSPYAREALEALLAGPTPAETRGGIATAIPEGVGLRSFSTRGYGGTEAVVDLSGLPVDAGAVGTIQIMTQVARTLIGVSGIERVRLRSDGRPWGPYDHAGRVMDLAIDYDLLGGWDACSGSGYCFHAVP